jgi:hypothetical protein
MVCHWTGIHFNGQELGFKIFQTVVGRLRERYGEQVRWMKLSEIARYWAAKELTAVAWAGDRTALEFNAPFACPGFTVRVPAAGEPAPEGLKEVSDVAHLRSGSYLKTGDSLTCCVDLRKGRSQLRLFKSRGT